MEKKMEYRYLDVRTVQNWENLFVLLEGLINANMNFGYHNNSQEKFGKDWCGESRIQGSLKRGLRILDFTIEDLYIIMDEALLFATVFIINTALESDLIVKFIDFLEEFYKRKRFFDLFEVSWEGLEYRRDLLIGLLVKNDPDNYLFNFEVERLQRLKP